MSECSNLEKRAIKPYHVTKMYVRTGRLLKLGYLESRGWKNLVLR